MLVWKRKKNIKKCHEAFDEKMEIMKQKGYAVIDHDLIKTPEQIAKNKRKLQNQYRSS